jgi:uncharacterized membrane protein
VLIPFLIIIALVAAVPILIFLDGPIIVGIVAIIAAIVAALSAASIRPGEAAHFERLARGVWLILLVPILMLVAQLLPIPAGGLSRSIWQSAGDAIGHSLLPLVTIDPGATTIALGTYLVLVAVLASAAILTIDRRRAELVLLVLTAAASASALIVVVHDMAGFTFLGDISRAGSPRPAIATMSAFGMVIAAASAILMIERQETRHPHGRRLMVNTVIPIGLATIAFLASILSLFLSSDGTALFAGSCGLAVVAIIVAIRRLGLAAWASVLLSAMAIATAVAVVVTRASLPDADLTLRFASHASASLVAMSERMIGDVGWLGSGARTFAAIVPIYRDAVGSGAVGAPTLAAQFAVEWGRIGFWVDVIVLLALSAVFARGGLSRGRDSFYATAGAGVGFTALVAAFGNPGLANIGPEIWVAALFGLALAQSLSRTL